MEKLDMSWGSPAFLISYWESTPIITDDIKKPQPYQFGSRDELKCAIRELHCLIGNANVENKHIVVAAGATQIVLGLMQVFKTHMGIKSAWAEPPHFSRFPGLAKYAGLEWKKDRSSLRVGTIPNNPDGISVLHKKTDILDLTYNWPQYTKNMVKYDHPVMVFSLSKATGHASTRIGWAILEDEQLAQDLEQFVELSTSGLSIDSQVKAEKVIQSQLTKDWTVFKSGKKSMEFRWSVVNRLKRNNLLPFKILNDSGMFIWAEGECPKNILCLPGDKMGGKKNQFRLNIGCSDVTFSAFVKLFTVR